jgi:enoyl-CoA hydratase/carnithine racemase
MLYLGTTLDAADALVAGLVDRIAESPLDAAREMAATVGKRSWRAVELTKLALGLYRPATTSFDVVAQALSFESDDKRQRIGAYLDRQKNKIEVATEEREVDE